MRPDRERTVIGEATMLLFVRMPSLSIQVFECANESELLDILRDLHKKYDPHFPTRIATVSGFDSEPIRYGKFKRMFDDDHISKTSQFKPSPILIDFLNENHDHHPQFRMIEYVKDWENVIDSAHAKNFVKIDIGVSLEKKIMLEAARLSMNPFDIMTNDIRLCQDVRDAVSRGLDVEKAMGNLRIYLTRKRD